MYLLINDVLLLQKSFVGIFSKAFNQTTLIEYLFFLSLLFSDLRLKVSDNNLLFVKIQTITQLQ